MPLIKSNLVATAAPTVNSDTTEGYTVGSVWTDVTNDLQYTCIDSTDGAAKWIANGESSLTTTASSTTTGTITLDISASKIYTTTLTGNATAVFTNPNISGTTDEFTWILTQDESTARSVTWPTSVEWGASGTPRISRTEIFRFYTVDGGTVWYGEVISQSAIASGGTVSVINGYQVHRFTSSGSFTVNLPITADILVVGGGGGGGGQQAGGGGAGEYKYETGQSLGVGSYAIEIGAGGAGAAGTATNGGPGLPSTFVVTTISSLGGGYGGTAGNDGGGGASGGGGGSGAYAGGSFTETAGGTSTTSGGYGNDGGKGGTTNFGCGGGGGGAADVPGGVGKDYPEVGDGGDGGDGRLCPITSTYFAGGGGGGGDFRGVLKLPGVGGSGVGGTACDPTKTSDFVSIPAAPNTGSGGAGSSFCSGTSSTPGSGADGVVIIRYIP